MSGDRIELRGVEVSAFIGVPGEERALPQTLELDVTLWPGRPLTGLGDRIENTVNYFAVWQRLRQVAVERPRRLIETLAEDVVSTLLDEFPVSEVEVTVHKFILPGTRAVALTVRRVREGA